MTACDSHEIGNSGHLHVFSPHTTAVTLGEIPHPILHPAWRHHSVVGFRWRRRRSEFGKNVKQQFHALNASGPNHQIHSGSAWTDSAGPGWISHWANRILWVDQSKRVNPPWFQRPFCGFNSSTHQLVCQEDYCWPYHCLIYMQCVSAPSHGRRLKSRGLDKLDDLMTAKMTPRLIVHDHHPPPWSPTYL